MKKKTKFLLGTALVITATSLALAAKTNRDFNGIIIKAENMK